MYTAVQKQLCKAAQRFLLLVCTGAGHCTVVCWALGTLRVLVQLHLHVCAIYTLQMSLTSTYQYLLSSDDVTTMKELLALKDGNVEGAGRWKALVPPPQTCGIKPT